MNHWIKIDLIKMLGHFYRAEQAILNLLLIQPVTHGFYQARGLLVQVKHFLLLSGKGQHGHER